MVGMHFRTIAQTAAAVISQFINDRVVDVSALMVAGFVEIAERKEFLGCGDLQPSELFRAAL
jgi:hypothetical protein